jgi:hypothetical protein
MKTHSGSRGRDRLSPANRGREMGQRGRLNAKKKYCANDVIPQYERYYQRALEAPSASAAST